VSRAALLAITPNEDFYVTTKGDAPNVRAADWRLKLDGLVVQPLTLTFSELRVLPPLEKVLALECISNPIGGHYLGNARWTGTPLRPLLELVQPTKEAAYGG
jgi:DMSO/TMAO reductase YedYZ molybdopterin-dependent catalytic subunit